MAKIIEARAVLSGEEKISPLLDKVAKKFGQFEKAAKQSTAVDKVAKSMERLRTQVQALEKFNAARLGFAKARENFRNAERAVEAAARAMRAGQGDARRLESEYRRAQQTVASAAAAFDRQKNAVLSAKHAMEGMGGSIRNMIGQEHRLATAVDRTAAAMRRQAHWAARRRELGVLGASLGIAIGHRTMRGARATFETYKDFDKERRFGKAVMGITDEQQAPLVSQAIHLGATTKYNDIQVLEAQRELAARGLKLPQVQGVINPAANLGQALDLSLPDAAKLLEGSLFGFRKDLSSAAAATASATRTADLQTKAAKISGMTPEDLRFLSKQSNTARLGGVSEETLLAFGGILKKANIGGDESNIAFRALMAAAQSPTRKAREAMLANGMNFKNYQINRGSIPVQPFVENIAAQYGVKLDKRTQAGLGKIFSNYLLISDPAKFTPAVTQMLKRSLKGNDAKSLKSIAGAASRYRDASAKGVDTNRFIADLMQAMSGNLQFANAVFGSKQGARISTALGDPATFKKMLEELTSGSEGYAAKIADERMAGFDGAVSRFEGAIKNLETAIGRSFDAGGKGGALTELTNMAGQLTQSMAELDPHVIKVGSGMALIAGSLAGLKGIVNLSSLLFGDGGLKGSATALDGSAAALSRAAVALGGKDVLNGAPGAPGAPNKPGSPPGKNVPMMLPFVQYLTYEAGKYGIDSLFQALPKPNYPAGYDPDKELNKSIWERGKGVWDRLSSSIGGSTPSFNDRWGPIETQLKGEAKVTGEATINLRLPDGTIQRVNVPLRGTVSANGPGSLGTSSPDAAAPSGAL